MGGFTFPVPCRTEEGTQREAAEAGAAEGAGWRNSSGCVCPASVCAPRACRSQLGNTREISGSGDAGRDEKRKSAGVSFHVLSVTSTRQTSFPPSSTSVRPFIPCPWEAVQGRSHVPRGCGSTQLSPSLLLRRPTHRPQTALGKNAQRKSDRLHSPRSRAVLSGPSSGRS